LSIKEEWKMECPNCHGDESLYVEAMVAMDVRLCEDGTDDDGDGDRVWDEDSGASCRSCNWRGTVREMKKAYEDRVKAEDHEDLRRHDALGLND
jgi:hypothetical protein